MAATATPTPHAFPVRACSIRCKDHPEWGTFGVMEDRGSYYEIFGSGGWRTLAKDEAARFWELAPRAPLRSD